MYGLIATLGQEVCPYVSCLWSENDSLTNDERVDEFECYWSERDGGAQMRVMVSGLLIDFC